MTAYVILFRGVGGATQLPVTRLREVLTADGFEKVTTYINSGNAVLRSDLARDAVVERVAAVCAREFGFTKAVYAVDRAGWAALIADNPFPDAVGTGKWLHAAVLSAVLETARVRALEALCQGRDRIAVVGTVAYLHTPDGFGTSAIGKAFDRGIGVPNTARNWNTVTKLMELAENADCFG